MNNLTMLFRLVPALGLVLAPLLSPAQVEKMEGPYDVYYVKDLLIGNDDRVFLGSSGGLYQSDNFGMAWEKVKAPFNTIYLEPILEKGSNGTIYMGGREDVFYSEDNGDSWNLLSNIGYEEIIRSLYPKSDTLFIGTDKGLKYLVNKKWEAREVEELQGLEILHIKSIGTRLLAASRNKVMSSADKGLSWQDITPDKQNLQIMDLEIVKDGIYLSTTFNGLLYSNDFGQSWQEKNEGIDSRENLMDLYQDGSTMYLLTRNRLYKSGADQLAWVEIRDNPGFTYSHEAIIAKDDQIMVGTWFGLFTSSDAGQSWDRTVTGITDVNVTDLKMSADSTLFVAGSNTGVYQKKKNEEAFTFFSPLLGSGGSLGKLLLNDGLLYILKNQVQAFDAQTGELVKTFKYEQGIMFYSNMVKAGDEFFLATLGSGIWKYTKEEEWLRFNTGLPSLNVQEVELVEDKLYAVTDQGLFSTPVASENWQRIDVAGVEAEARKFKANGALMVAAVGPNTYISQDSGNTWGKIKVVENEWVYDIAFQEDEIYVATFNSIYVSKDKGKNWRILTRMQEFSSFNALLPVGDVLYAGTTENGIYKIGTELFEPELALIGEDGSLLEENITFPDAKYKEENKVWLSIRNSGNDTLVLSDPPVIFEGEGASAFSYAEVVSNQKIAPYTDGLFPIIFMPTTLDEYQATAKIVSNDPQQPILTLQLSGKADVLTSIGDNAPGEGIKLAPNPVQGKLKVFFGEGQKIPMVMIRDLTGKAIPLPTYSYSPGTYELEVSHLPAGIYLLSLVSESKTWSGKFVKE